MNPVSNANLDMGVPFFYNQETRKSVALCLIFAALYAGSHCAFKVDETLKLKLFHKKKICSKLNPQEITSSLLLLDNQKLTELCKSHELINSHTKSMANFHETSCGKTAYAVSQFVGEKLYHSDVIFNQFIGWKDLQNSLILPDARIYQINFCPCTFQDEITKEKVRFPGHAFAIIQYPLEKGITARYQLCQSYIKLYTIKDYISQNGKTLLTLDELQSNYLDHCKKIKEHRGTWPWEMACAFSNLTHTKEGLSLQNKKPLRVNERLCVNFVLCEPGYSLFKSVSRETISNISYVSAVILGSVATLSFLSLGTLAIEKVLPQFWDK